MSRRTNSRTVAAALAAVTGAALLTGAAASAGDAQPVAQSATTVRPPSPRPKIIYDPIPFGPVRQRQMAGYAWRHYRVNSALLPHPRVIVLHFTVSPDYQSAHNWFAMNQPAPGPAGTRAEAPGACTQFVIDKVGRIYQQVPLGRMCRHIIGLNHVALGIEFVEMTSASNILNRPRQLAAGRALVRWLQTIYTIPRRDVVGHGTANSSRYFRDLKGWKNDHTDWNQRQVDVFRLGTRP